MNIEVRLAGKEDLNVINEFLNEIEDCDYDIRGRKFIEALESDLAYYFLAVSESEIIGILNLWYLPDAVDGGVIGIILDVYISGEFRNRGVSKMLMESAMEIGEKLGIDKYFCWMAPENEAAIGLFKHFGFSRESLMLEKR